MVQGSDITGTNSATLKASDGVTIKSAEELYNEKTKSSNSSASIGVNVGVGVTGVNASASANASAGNSSSDTNSVNNVNSIINGGNNLSIASGKDTTISGANISAKNVDLNVGRNLTIASVQDTMNSKSSSSGVNVGLSISATTTSDAGSTKINAIEKTSGANFGINGSNGSSDSKIVNNQTSVTAEGGTLNVKVGDTTTINGGLLAAKDETGKDSGNLNLTTGKLVVTDIKDTNNSKNISLGINADINNPLKKSETNNGNTPTIDGSYSSSTFAQDTKGTIGNGNIQIADATSSTPLEQINRDIANSQVVTKDKQSGFTIYQDKGASEELGKMFENGGSQSVILSSISEILNNPQAVSDKIISQAKALLGNDSGSVQDELKINILLSQNGVEKTREIMVEKEYNQSLEVLEKNPEYQAAPPQEQEIARASARKAAQLNVTMRVEAFVNKGQKINDTQVQRLANSLNTPSQPSENTADQQSQSTSTNSANETVIVTGVREKNNLTDTTKKVLEGTLELTGKASENKYVQMGLAAYGTVKSLTPMGVIQTITAKAITAIAPNQVAAVAGKIDEVSTKASAVANGAISNNSATKYVNAYEAGKEDVTNKETNYYRTTGGKVVVNTAAATFVGSAVGIGAKSISKTVTVRPSPKASEKYVLEGLGPDAKPQVSYKDGAEVTYATKGSTRPDACLGNCSFEVKNYKLDTNINGLINNASKQAIERAKHLPEGMTQEIKIDARGQVLTAAMEKKIILGIVKKSNGIIKPENINIIKK